MTIVDYVFQAMQKHPQTRSDDSELVRQVFRAYAVDHGLPVNEADTIARALPAFPKVRTIVRTRADLQRKYPDLCDPSMQIEREELSEVYREKYTPNKD